MSLQVWLPLNGNLNNQGLDGNITVTNNGAVIDDYGKIGKCYSTDGVSSYINCGGYTSGKPNRNISICFWMYPKDIAGNKLCAGSLHGSNQRLYFGILDGGYLSFGAGDTMWDSGPKVNANTWYHVILTFDNSGIGRMYVNGQLGITRSTGTFNFYGDFDLGRGNGGESYRNMLFNDFRIYDHCLTETEIRDLSRGLIVHYTLNNPYLEPTTNILYSANLYFGPLTIDTSFTKNGEVYTVTTGNIIEGYNSCTWRMNIPLELLENNAQYSCSFKYKVISGNGKITGFDWCDYYLVSKVEEIDGDVHYFKLVCPVISYTDVYRFLNFYSDASNTVYEIYDIQLEKKNHITPYAYGVRNMTVVSDDSGNGNDGTINQNAICIYDSSRYDCAIKGDCNITCPNITLQNPFTICQWLYIVADGNTGNGTVNRVGNINLYRDWDGIDKYTYAIYTTSGTTGYYTPLINITTGWYHMVLVSDGTYIKSYVNGVGGGNYNCIPAASSNFNLMYSNNVGMSDFRLYGTALPLEDILELYKISAFINRSKDFNGFEMAEAKYTDILPDYTDISLIQMAGWSGTKSYDSTDGCLVLTATSGWRTFAWDTSAYSGQKIYVDFDYMFTDLTNISYENRVNVHTGSTVGFYIDKMLDISKTNVWKHFSSEFTADNYLGIMLRGVDSTGLSVTMKVKNMTIIAKPNEGSDTRILKTGIVQSCIFKESDDICEISKDIITANEFVEI